MPRLSVAWVMLQRVPPDMRIFTPGLRFFSRSNVRRPRSAARSAAINPAAPAPTTTAFQDTISSGMLDADCSMSFVHVQLTLLNQCTTSGNRDVGVDTSQARAVCLRRELVPQSVGAGVRQPARRRGHRGV